jgi:ribonuclease Z
MTTSGNLTAFSKGLYSNWFYHKPTRTLFDCGEGFATSFGNFSYGIERVCLSHGHGDHVLGLPSLIGCRNSGRGDKEKPLEIYFPNDNYSVIELQKFIMARNKHLNYDVKWIPMLPYQQIEINKKTYIESFNMEHQRNFTTLGYNVIERRSRLLPKYRGQDIAALIRSGINKDSVNEIYLQKVLSYCLDAWKFNPENIQGSELAIMDCTFLSGKERDDTTHFTLEESIKLCENTGVKAMLAAHFSGRYHHHQITEACADIIPTLKSGLTLDWILPGHTYIN